MIVYYTQAGKITHKARLSCRPYKEPDRCVIKTSARNPQPFQSDSSYLYS